ncbi:ComEA family DNA-binding protein [Geomonas sp. Red276]
MLTGSGGSTRLRSGDVVVLRRRTDGSAEIIVEKMHTKEKMLIGIPLNPDSLDAADWDLLPGIGPALAARIVDDRHKNGAFGSLDGVRRVPGVGVGKINIIRGYF